MPPADAIIGPVEETIKTGELLTEHCCPVLAVKAGAKRPIAAKDGSWLIIDDPDDVAGVVHGLSAGDVPPNLALVLYPKAGSNLVVVDVDGAAALPRLRELGVSKHEGNWQIRTGGGGLALVYWRPHGDLQLPRVIKAGGLPVDLLVDGYQLCPPSRTKGAYRWVEGHSFRDIAAAELEPPPDPLVAWWLEHGASPTTTTANGTGGKAWALVGQPIPDGQSNDSLTSIAGWLRLYHPPAVVEALLLAINDARCDPPLPGIEVSAIARSVSRYEAPGVVGHPKAVVPAFTREAAQ